MTKTEFMLIGSRQKLNSLSAIPALEINGTQLNRVNFTKSLGVLIDENLTWSNRINAIIGFSNLAGGWHKSPATLSICAGYFFVFQILLIDNPVSPM